MPLLPLFLSFLLSLPLLSPFFRAFRLNPDRGYEEGCNFRRRSLVVTVTSFRIEIFFITERHPEESRATSTLMDRQRGDDKGELFSSVKS